MLITESVLQMNCGSYMSGNARRVQRTLQNTKKQYPRNSAEIRKGINDRSTFCLVRDLHKLCI